MKYEVPDEKQDSGSNCVIKVIPPQSICCDIGINIITIPLLYKNIAAIKYPQGQEGKSHLNSNLYP